MKKSSNLSIVGEAGGSEKGACGTSVSVNVMQTARGIAPAKFRGRAAVVTLGCAKNQVDSEVMLGFLQREGFEVVTELDRADVAVVNTCSFLESAVKESIDCILEVGNLKKSGRLRKLIVAGCLVERYRDDLVKSLPEVDAFVRNDDIPAIGKAATDDLFRGALEEGARPYFLYDDEMPRTLATPRHTAYVKVSEGCNRPCTFCSIPSIRGAMRSRSIPSVVSEVRALGEQGVREISLIAQDLTSFGTDVKNGGLLELVRALDADRAVDWIRLMYAYPVGVTEELLKAIVSAERVCNYLDIPLQHSSEPVLRLMKRPVGKYAARPLVEFMRTHAPELAIRTTLIVGFPGETEADIADLESFVSEGHFTNLGVFTYSREEGTPSHDLPGQVPEKQKKERRDRVMKAQQRVVAARNETGVGKIVRALVDGPHPETELLFQARTEQQAPEVDGAILINDIDESVGKLQSGDFVSIEITEVAGYDLIGRVVSRE